MDMKLLGGSLVAAAVLLCPLTGNASANDGAGHSTAQSLHAKNDQQNGCEFAGHSRSTSRGTARGFLPDENVVCGNWAPPAS